MTLGFDRYITVGGAAQGPRGPKGDQGPPGPKGEQGPQGDQGPMGDVTPEAVQARDQANVAAVTAVGAAATAQEAAGVATTAAAAAEAARDEAQGAASAASAAATTATTKATEAAASAALAEQARLLGATIGFATKADMDASLSHPDGTLALVTSDPTPANNGTYRKTGASGSGAWVQSADRVTAFEPRVASAEVNSARALSGLNGHIVTDTGAVLRDPAAIFRQADKGGFFTLRDIATLAQNSDGTGAISQSGDPIGLLRDKVTGATLTQATAANRPAYDIDGSAPRAIFDGAGDRLAGNLPGMAFKPTAYMVFAIKRGANAAAHSVISISSSPGSNNYLRIFANTSERLQIESRSDTAGHGPAVSVASPQGMYGNSQPHVVEAIWRPVGGSHELYIDGQFATEVASNLDPGMSFGQAVLNIPGVTSSAGFAVYAGAVLDRIPSASERAAFRRYMQYAAGKGTADPALAGMVEHMWTGHVSDTSATVSTKVIRQKSVRLAASKSASMESPIFSPTITVDSFGIARGTISGLQPSTTYYIAVEGPAGQVGREVVGTVKTFPAAGAQSFNFIAASCADTGAEGWVFRNIKAKADARLLDFGIQMGDIHYENSGPRPLSRYYLDYDKIFLSQSQHAMYRSLPWYHMRDDHEVDDGAWAGMDGTDRWITLYRNRVPHPPLASATATDPPYYSFVKGRVRFVVTDLNSDRSNPSAVDDANKFMMGPAQLAWFYSELGAAKAAGQAIAWINTLPWIGGTSAQQAWGAYTTQRAAIAAHIVAEGLTSRMVIISGDMHALAYDDGTNAPGGVKVCHCAPFHRTNSLKGGPYTIGPITLSESQYGVFNVTDPGGANPVTVRFRGVAVDKLTGVEQVAIDQSFTLAAA